jgi:hypothetical protein
MTQVGVRPNRTGVLREAGREHSWSAATLRLAGQTRRLPGPGLCRLILNVHNRKQEVEDGLGS